MYMSTAVSIPTTLEERLKMGAESRRYPIAYSEFLDLLEQAEYPIEYENGELIIRSIASDEHEQLVANILYAEQDRPLVTLFERIPDSNRWRSTDFNELKQKLEIGHFSILMEDIYDNVF